MSVRTWLYGRLTSFTPLTDLIGDTEPRVYAKKSMTSSREMHPYIVYKLGYNAAEELSEDPSFADPERQFIQIFVHDFSDQETADYMQIDEVVKQLKLALHGQTVGSEGIYYVRYLETSQDLDDDTLNTVMKYVRFQIVKQGETS